VDSQEEGAELLQNLHLENNPGAATLTTHLNEKWALVEAFDAALVVQSIDIDEKQKKVLCKCNYDYQVLIDPNAFLIDQWDRFHAYTETNPKLPPKWQKIVMETSLV
jgi:peroxiredoxin